MSVHRPAGNAQLVVFKNNNRLSASERSVNKSQDDIEPVAL